ncbi:MAG TPA: 2-amino-4-hydroxy-6-hydroxymethyldihydropteridine diphosphokinase [Thermoanaerobaculaceae bacterium]|nr:2-amino-4-hydroxy-6-hydroxymethyldihydropteridine diphosphokinase [Acidobacteriota bacterium]HPW54750.1 2-amino-4-hydroxy-6-hydroxymethyldihydropteridine diphosphokinase [Thermoanaerobaculaceae bacterium]
MLGFGGNQGDVAATFAGTLSALGAEHPVVAISRLWRSAAIGPPQPDYLNAAVLIELRTTPQALLRRCHELEHAAGRNRTREPRWGPRSIDLDLLIAPGLVVLSPDLTLPHPRLAERRFALLPACELVPAWTHPRLRRPLAALLAALDPAAQPCHPVGPWGPTGRS